MMPATSTVGESSPPRFTVLQSTGRPDDTTNPYLVQLLRSLPDGVDIKYFSVRDALLSHYDLFHVHWPEYLIRHPTVLGAYAKKFCLFLLLLRLWATRVPIVRTLHNARPHEQGGPIERMLLGWLDRLTTRRIRINAAAPNADPATDTILHGHYRDWFAAQPVPASVPGRLLYFGLIRPYKGVETLIEAFRDMPDASATLRIVGNPATPAMRQTVEDACVADPRISARLEYVGDDVLAREIGEAQWIVLPYREMQNSGALLLALSLSRPVLVPRTDANVAIAEEVGSEWVRMFDGGLDAALLSDTLGSQFESTAAAPDLSRRDWPVLGERHYRTYLSALRTATHRAESWP
jgi:beta-1,4-mannosyltransferase